MARRRKRYRRRRQFNTFSFTSSLPKGRKAKKKAQKKARSDQAEKLNNKQEQTQSMGDVLKDAFGFEDVELKDTPFGKSFDTETQAVNDMQLRYNYDSDEKRFMTMQQKGYIQSLYEYNKLMSIYQSDVYVKLKELGYSDSHQIMDLIQSFDNNISATDIENALLSLIDELKLQQNYNTAQIREAMELGFSFDDAVYLTESDRVDEIKPEDSLIEIRDRLSALLETREIRKQLADELRKEKW